MCGTRKLQCHVQGRQPIEICGIGKWAQMILLCLLPSLPWHQHKIQNLQGERGRGLLSWTRKKKEKALSHWISVCIGQFLPPDLSSYLPFEYKHSSTIVQRLDSGQLLGLFWWRGLLHLTNGPSSKSLTKDPIHSKQSHLPFTSNKLAWWNGRLKIVTHCKMMSNIIYFECAWSEAQERWHSLFSLRAVSLHWQAGTVKHRDPSHEFVKS